MPRITEINGASGLAGVYQQRPQLWQAFRFHFGALWECAVLDPVILDLCRLKSAFLTGCRH
jgi:hypothetical protein